MMLFQSLNKSTVLKYKILSKKRFILEFNRANSTKKKIQYFLIKHKSKQDMSSS